MTWRGQTRPDAHTYETNFGKSQKAKCGCVDPFPFSSVGIGLGESYLPCGGNGLCYLQTGQCTCFLGYTGVACDKCDYGAAFGEANGQCSCMRDVNPLCDVPGNYQDPVKSAEFTRIASVE